MSSLQGCQQDNKKDKLITALIVLLSVQTINVLFLLAALIWVVY